MSSEALEQALALYRAPAQRFALRDRALPPDIGEVIRLASGNAELLRHAAGVLCEPESVVLEAVRFYLQQVLFDADADAYRVLGLEPDAPHERIRDHYLWLQRWVHPDRRGDDWVALYSTRVNGAWNQLRNPAAREDYDRTQVPTSTHAGVMHHPVGGVWMPIPVALPQRNWARPAVLGLSLTTCAVLLVAVLLKDDRSSDDWSSAERTSMGQAENVRSRTSLEPSTGRMASGSRPAEVQAKPLPGGRPAANASIKGRLLSPVTPLKEGSTSPVSHSFSRVASAVLATGPDSTAARIGTPNQSEVHGPSSTAPNLAVGNPRRRLQAENLPTSEPDPAEVGTPFSERASIAAGAGASDRTAAQRFGRRGHSLNSRSQNGPATLPSIPRIVSINSVVTVDQAAGQSVVSAVAPPLPVDMVARMDLARQRVRDVAAYFGGRTANLPASWLDAAGQLNAERLRYSLYARNQLRNTARFALEAPNWTLSHDSAGVSATYRVRRDRLPSESGRFFVDMTWRDDAWQVTRLALEPMP